MNCLANLGKCFQMNVVPGKCKGVLREFRGVRNCSVLGEERLSGKFLWKKIRIDAYIS